jgi:hypothetical protein
MWDENNRFRGMVVSIYLALIVVCAAVYDYKYRVDHRNFYFAADSLTASRVRESAFEADQVIARLVAERAALAELYDALRVENAIFKVRTVFDVDELRTNHYSFGIDVVVGGPAELGTMLGTSEALIVSTLDGKFVAREPLSFADGAYPAGFAGRRAAFLRGLSDRDGRLAVAAKVDSLGLAIGGQIVRLRADREGVLRGIRGPWTFVDFLYFSVITQASVGYGDILPNSMSVRVLVMAQVLIGLLLLGVLINVTIQRK